MAVGLDTAPIEVVSASTAYSQVTTNMLYGMLGVDGDIIVAATLAQA